MKLIIEGDESYIDTGTKDIEGEPLYVHNMNGYGATAVSINECGGLTWRQVDLLKEAIALAEKHWRNNKE